MFSFKVGDLDEAAEGVRERSRMFDERFGSALVLTKGGTRGEAPLQTGTRGRLLLTIEDTKAGAE